MPPGFSKRSSGAGYQIPDESPIKRPGRFSFPPFPPCLWVGFLFSVPRARGVRLLLVEPRRRRCASGTDSLKASAGYVDDLLACARTRCVINSAAAASGKSSCVCRRTPHAPARHRPRCFVLISCQARGPVWAYTIKPRSRPPRHRPGAATGPSTAIDRHAIESTQLRGHRRVDGAGRLEI